MTSTKLDNQLLFPISNLNLQVPVQDVQADLPFLVTGHTCKVRFCVMSHIQQSCLAFKATRFNLYIMFMKKIEVFGKHFYNDNDITR